MTDWLSELKRKGPRQPTTADVADLNRLFSDSFTDRYRKDGLVGVRVPQLNPDIWQYAIRDAGRGAMLWFDEKDQIVAFNMAHHSGLEGWMGPLAVRPDRQGSGLGSLIVETAIDWLRAEGVTTLGLETMPRTVENIGFYGKLGFVPKHLTMTMTRDAGDREPGMQFKQFSELEPEARESVVERCRESVEDVFSGYDFTREFDLSIELGVGDAVVVQTESKITGFALWHSAPLAHNRSGDELRVLKLFADSLEVFVQVVLALEAMAERLRLPAVAIRCQTGYEGAYRKLTELGYRVRWTDLRMTLGGYAEPTVPGEEVLFSNWEI